MKVFAETHPDDVVQGDELTALFAYMMERLQRIDGPEDFDGFVVSLRSTLSHEIMRHRLSGASAVEAVFVCDMLEAWYSVRPATIGYLGSYLWMMSASPDAWARHRERMIAAGQPPERAPDRPLSLAMFRPVVLSYLVRAGEDVVIAALYRLVRLRLDGMIAAARRDPATVGEWEDALVLLGVHLVLRHACPIVTPLSPEQGALGNIRIGQSAVGGDPVSAEHVAPCHAPDPLAIRVLGPDYDDFRRREAYAEETCAHLMTAAVAGHIGAAAQDAMAVEYARRAARGRLNAREWLALARTRFEAAPCVGR